MPDPRNDPDKTTGVPVLDIATPKPDETPSLPPERSADDEIVRDTAVQGGED